MCGHGGGVMCGHGGGVLCVDMVEVCYVWT